MKNKGGGKNGNFTIGLSDLYQKILTELANSDGESRATIIRTLLRAEAKKRGIWPKNAGEMIALFGKDDTD